MLPPEPPPIPTVETLIDLRDQGKQLKVLGNAFKLQADDELVPPLTTATLYKRQPDGSIGFKAELRRLSSELLFMLMELLHTLVARPAAYPQHLTTVNMLLSNMLHLINAMRPHQARATLEASLRLQVEALRSSIARVNTQVAAADEVLAGFAKALADASEPSGAESSSRPPPILPLDAL